MRKTIVALMAAVLMVSVVPSVSLAEEVGTGDENYTCTYAWYSDKVWVSPTVYYYLPAVWECR